MTEDTTASGISEALQAICAGIEAEEGPLTDRKRRIVEAAIVCFAEAGFEGASTAEIAKRAEVAEATIFRHFSTKKDLLVRLVRAIAGQVLIPAALAELEDIKARSGSQFGKIAEAVMLSRIRFADRYAPLLRIVIQEMPLQPELRTVLFSEGVQRGLAALYQAFAELAAAGEIRSDIPPDRLFRWFGSLIAGYYAVRTFLPDGTFDDAAEIAATVEFMLSGAAPPPPERAL